MGILDFRLRYSALPGVVAFALTVPMGCHRPDHESLVSTGSLKGHVRFRVRASPSNPLRLRGRLLVFVKRLPADGVIEAAVDINEFKMEETWVAARDLGNLAPGETVEVEADEGAYPKSFSELPAGRYEAQAVLDMDHSYGYGGRDAEDLVSEVVVLNHWNPAKGEELELTIDRQPGRDWKQAAAALTAKVRAKLAGAREEEFSSPALNRFWGRPVMVRAWVILPPGYAGSGETYPTAYWTHGFSGNLDSALSQGLQIYDRMKDGRMPPMIWVMLDESVPQGTHEFADSANNGPWGVALTGEFIPYLENKYRMDARPSGRLLNGHSSGGWATLQLQVNYPTVFGGTWSTSPDSSDFHDFNGVDLYAPNANLYRRSDGSAVPILREKGEVLATMEEIGRLEAVLGPYGGQMTSFDWVFSPKGQDGAPMPMFDRETGKIDSGVVAYWREHYDLSHLVETNWAERGSDLQGRIHVTVGTADTFYLDGAARRFEAVLARLGAGAHFTYLPGRSHFDVYLAGDDPGGLFDEIGSEMYATARPGTAWRSRGR